MSEKPYIPPVSDPENAVQLQSDIYRPSETKGKFTSPTKDLTLSKITDFDAYVVDYGVVMIDAIIDASSPDDGIDLTDLAEMHASQLRHWINSRRAIDGFERVQSGTQRIVSEGKMEYKGQPPQGAIKV